MQECMRSLAHTCLPACYSTHARTRARAHARTHARTHIPAYQPTQAQLSPPPCPPSSLPIPRAHIPAYQPAQAQCSPQSAAGAPCACSDRAALTWRQRGQASSVRGWRAMPCAGLWCPLTRAPCLRVPSERGAERQWCGGRRKGRGRDSELSMAGGKRLVLVQRHRREDSTTEGR